MGVKVLQGTPPIELRIRETEERLRETSEADVRERLYEKLQQKWLKRKCAAWMRRVITDIRPWQDFRRSIYDEDINDIREKNSSMCMKPLDP